MKGRVHQEAHDESRFAPIARFRTVMTDQPGGRHGYGELFETQRTENEARSPKKIKLRRSGVDESRQRLRVEWAVAKLSPREKAAATGWGERKGEERKTKEPQK